MNLIRNLELRSGEMIMFSKGETRNLQSGSDDDESGRTESIAGCGRMQQRILHGFTQHEGRQVIIPIWVTQL